MEEAIGSKISDYLIKPVNPNQILLTIKKSLDTKRLVAETTSYNYQREFREISMKLSDRLNYEEWKEVYKQLVHWEVELEKSKEDGMSEILDSQKNEANAQFFKFVENNYIDWMNGHGYDSPTLSHTVFKNEVAPKVGKGKPTFMFLIDNLRWDQWLIIKPAVLDIFKFESEDIFLSILPTATQYSRNAIFAGLTPLDIENRFGDKWLNDEDEGGKNMYEEDFLEDQLKRLNLGQKFSYNKITKHQAGKKLVDAIPNLMNNDLNVIVYNFVDMLSHARTEMEMIRELADDESAYRSITLSWFEHSPLKDMMERVAEYDANIVITTDHGTVRVQEPSKVIGDKNTNTNLRYKQAKNLNFEEKDVFAVKNPHDAYLPKVNVSQSFIFAKEDKFFAYPNNYNYYVNFYRNTFQHGGISLEEMMIPIIHLRTK
jgi:hypothetical protein